MRIIKLNEENFLAAINEAKNVLSGGGVVLVPTETVYGLVCQYHNESAREKIYQLKKRDKNKLFAAFIRDYRKLSEYGLEITPLIDELVADYCPGKITIIGSCGDGKTLGFRVPDHKFILKLLEVIDFPLASTSANVSGEPNILDVEEAIATLNGEVDLIIDAGSISSNSLASTVVDATSGEKIKILRQGELIIDTKFL
jgi:L-threonylcarbamoyladenylate synthase